MRRNIDREGPIQRAVVSFLKYQYPSALVFSVPNELASKVGGGKDGAKLQAIIRNIQAKAKKMGMLPGMADVCMVLDGRFYAFEVKAEGNPQQDNQKGVEQRVEANGGCYFVVRSVDDVKAAMAGSVVDMATVPMMGVVS